MKYIDLFCGIGGFHQALSQLNCKCILACDIDKECRKTYQENYNMTPYQDIKTIVPNEIEDFDIICGGFPCQAFSNAGKKKTFADKRGLLFDEIIRIAVEKKPKFMFLENVKHILKVDNGKVIDYIKNKIHEIGYKLQLLQISPHQYGIPQQRERIYFICVRNDIYNGSDVILRHDSHNYYDSSNLLETFLDTNVNEKYNIQGDILDCLNAWEEMIKIFEVNEKISPVIMINDFYKNHSQSVINSFPKWKQDYINANKSLIEKYKDKWDIWYDKHKDLLQKREIYGKLEWQVGKIKPNDSIFNYFIQIRQSGIRVKRSQYFPTLVAISQIPIYGKEKRYITPRECARLQSFPETFKINQNDKISYKQFGNAINVSNAYTVIKATFDHYNIK